VKGRAPTYAEVLEAARRAARDIEENWPEWKRALSLPGQERDDVPAAPAEPGEPSR
jgi:hypothetical protein